MTTARLLLAGLLALRVAGAEVVGIDQPSRWFDPGASHHLEHGLGGAAIGVTGYAAAALVTDNRERRLAFAAGTGAVVGIGYELARGRDGTSLADPIDAAWVAAGAVAGALAADLTGQALSLAITPRSAAIALAIRF